MKPARPVRLDAPELCIQPARNYTAAEVAQLVFRCDPETFRHWRRQMMLEEGFPRPISKFGWAMWHGDDLLDWLRRNKAQQGAAGVFDLTPLLRARTAAIARKRRAES